MAEPSEDLWPVLTTVVIAAVSGILGAASTAVLIAIGITRKFAELQLLLIKEIASLRQHVDDSDSKRFHTMVNIVQGEIGKSEASDEELARRIGACEQEIAVLRNFMDRQERIQEVALRRLEGRS